MLATHAAIALIADDERLQFQAALASGDIIGQAKGKIMNGSMSTRSAHSSYW